MFSRLLSVVILLSLVPFATFAYSQVVGSASIRAPAVLPENNSATLTIINLTVTNGNGQVSVLGPAIIGNSTIESADTAAQYASGYLNLNFADYNFTYTIEADSSNVSGPSGGAAMTLLALSALSHRQLRNDFTITGTISNDGTIGEIGGVYNKVDAAMQKGLDLVLVPAVPQNSQEDELYLLVQSEFGVPIVQVSNMTQASRFAFNSSASGLPYRTKYNFYANYSMAGLPQATLTCSNGCNDDVFRALVNNTLNFTDGIIGALGSSSRFQNVSQQLGRVLNQSASIASHGYLYASANFAFLDYVDAFYFYFHNTTRNDAFSALLDVNDYCTSLMQPQMTSDNYEYLLGAELRQSWGTYTINNTISNYNATATDTDSILDSIRSGAEANGWCSAADFVFGSVSNSTGYPVDINSSLAGVALQKINRANQYGASMYTATAQQAYKDRNYPLAILDADYAFALSNASRSGLQTAQLLSAAQAMAQNSTYGVWATEFAKESQFYAYQSGATSNTTQAGTYAFQAYSTALLAEQMSADTRLIYQNMVPASGSNVQNAALAAALAQLAVFEELTTILLALVVLILVANLVLIYILIRKVSAKSVARTQRRRR